MSPDAEPTFLTKLFTAIELGAMDFDPLTEHVPGIITEGFGIFAGAPKQGKSWFTLGIGLAAAAGGRALGCLQLEQRDVLLLALEDSPRRLQQRCNAIHGDELLPRRLHILTDVAPGTVTATIEEWLGWKHDKPPLVLLDTLGKARPQRRAGDDPYIADYQFGSKLKRLVDAYPGAGLLCVHHTRKSPSDDFLDTVSGTQGIAGSADYVLVLNRKRTTAEAILSVTGRDINETEYALKTENGRWYLDGADPRSAAEQVEVRREQSKLGDRSLDAMKFVNSRKSTTPADLAKHLGIDGKVAGNLLARLDASGYIVKHRRGTYRGVRGETGETGETAGQEALPCGESPLSPLSSPLSCEQCGDVLPPDYGTGVCRKCAIKNTAQLNGVEL